MQPSAVQAIDQPTLELSPRTVKRLWSRARVWLYRELDSSEALELSAVSSIDR